MATGIETPRAKASYYLGKIKEWEAKLKDAGADLDADSLDPERVVEAAQEVFADLNLVAHEDE